MVKRWLYFRSTSFATAAVLVGEVTLSGVAIRKSSSLICAELLLSDWVWVAGRDTGTAVAAALPSVYG